MSRAREIADRDLAERVRNLAVSDPSLNEEQRVLIRKMSDEQILEMVSMIRNQSLKEETEETDYTTMKVTELKELLKERELPVSGTKAELIKRLQT